MTSLFEIVLFQQFNMFILYLTSLLSLFFLLWSFTVIDWGRNRDPIFHKRLSGRVILNHRWGRSCKRHEGPSEYRFTSHHF